VVLVKCYVLMDHVKYQNLDVKFLFSNVIKGLSNVQIIIVGSSLKIVHLSSNVHLDRYYVLIMFVVLIVDL